MLHFRDSMLELIIQTSTNLPPDVRAAMAAAAEKEQAPSQSSQALTVIANNIDLAHQDQGPICQDTGMPTFKIKTPVGANQMQMKQWIREAIAEATRQGKLRPNSVDSLTGKNSGDNSGPGTPIMQFDQWESENEIEVKLILKGGGCENKNIQYSLPCELPHLGRADRTLDGVRKCILHAVWQAQGQGCSAGAIGVGIGGDRTSGYAWAKEQLFRTLDDTNPNPELAALEEYVMQCCQHPRDRNDGFWRKCHVDWMQGRRVESFACQLLRLCCLRLLGLSPPRSRIGCVHWSHQALALSR